MPPRAAPARPTETVSGSSRTHNRDLMAAARLGLQGNWGLAIGVTIFWLSLSRTGSGAIGQVFSGFDRFGTAFLAYLLAGIFVFLWALLWKLFCLHWRFFGWALLCVLTLGIGFLWLGPYIAMSTAKFYDDLTA